MKGIKQSDKKKCCDFHRGFFLQRSLRMCDEDKEIDHCFAVTNITPASLEWRLNFKIDL